MQCPPQYLRVILYTCASFQFYYTCYFVSSLYLNFILKSLQNYIFTGRNTNLHLNLVWYKKFLYYLITYILIEYVDIYLLYITYYPQYLQQKKALTLMLKPWFCHKFYYNIYHKITLLVKILSIIVTILQVILLMLLNIIYTYFVYNL